MVHGKLLAHFYRDRFWIRLFALLPENKRWRYLQLLRDDCPQSKDRLRIRGIIAFHSHRFHLSAGENRSEEHTSELQSRVDLVCRLLLEKKKKKKNTNER